MIREFIGLNLQFPISRLILEGEKTVETRTYPLPAKYVGKEIAIIETPGKSGDFKARVICIAVFGESVQYKNSKEFYLDEPKHRVSKGTIWAWNPEKPKWAWPLKHVKPLAKPQTVTKKRGIRYTRGITVDI
jgi:hypothetical protein